MISTSLRLIILIFTVTYIFLSEWLDKLGLIALPSGIRHIVVLSCVLFVWLLSEHKKIQIDGKYKKLLFRALTLFVVGIFFTKGPLPNYFLGAVFTYFFVVVYLITSNTRLNYNNLIAIFKCYVSFIFLLSLPPIIEGLSQGTNLRWLPGVFRELGAFALAMNIAILICLSLFISSKNRIYFILALFFSSAVFMTVLKKSMIENILIWIYFIITHVKSKNRKYYLILLSSFMFVIIMLMANDIRNNITQNTEYLDRVGSSEHVRIGMFIAAYNIAADNFPLGSGFGTFASLSSIYNGYSELHHTYGVSMIGSNSPRDVEAGHHTLLDTFWPHILAEMGLLGGLLYVLIWFRPVQIAYKFYNSKYSLTVRALSFYIITIIPMMMLEGFVLYTPDIPSFILMHSALTGYCMYVIREKSKLHQVT